MNWPCLACALLVTGSLANITAPALRGSLPAADKIASFKAVSVCACSALCFVRPACASISHRGTDCQLYRRVATYATLLAGPAAYHHMPGHSRHHEFCSTHEDCVEPAERCWAGVCSPDTSVTCRTLRQEHGVTASGAYWGVVRERSVRLYCDMVFRGGGWTLLLAGNGDGWNTSSALWRPADGEPGPAAAYSIYQLADEIRDSRAAADAAGSYEIDVYHVPTSRGGIWRVPRSESLLATKPGQLRLTSLEGRVYGNWRLRKGLHPVVPWLAEGKRGALVTVSSQPILAAKLSGGTVLSSRKEQSWAEGSMVEGQVVLFIRE